MPSSSAHSSSEGEEVIDLALSPGAPEEGLVLTDGEDDHFQDSLLLRSSTTSSESDLMRRPNLSRLYSSSSSYQARPAKEEPIGIKAIAFGVFGDALSFSAEWEQQAGGSDGVFFRDLEGRGRSKSLVLEIGRQASMDKIRISIDLSTITRVQRSSGGKSFYLHLRLPPLFETIPFDSDRDRSRPSKIVSAFDADHARVAPYSSKVLRIQLRDSQEVPHFINRCTTRGLPRIVSSKISLEASRKIGATTLVKLSNWMKGLDLAVAFQVEKLVRNGLVDPFKMLSLRNKIEDVVEVQGAVKTERILTLFADSLTKIEELGEETPTVEIVLSDGEGEVVSSEPKGSKKRGRPHSVQQAPSTDARRKEGNEEEEDDDVILPPSFLSNQHSGPHNPHELSISDLSTLLDHSVTRSIVFAPLYSSVDPSKLARQVTLTPTGYLLGGPNLESSNSIARRYGRPEHFLRVAIRNEDGTLLDYRNSIDIVGSRFGVIFKEGFELGGRKWEFLAWSASALKAQACFFVSPFEEDGRLVNPETIHRDIGDFVGDPTACIPAKYFARISQAFTSSRPSIHVAPNQILKLDDLASESGSLFSDGVGTISPSLAADVVAALDSTTRGKRMKFTCFQVRVGGAKGMLQIDPSLIGKVVALRPSQVKFKSEMTSLEIADTFVAKTGFLNRPLIKLLEDLQVPAESLLKLQRSATERVRKSRKKLSSAIRLVEDWNLSHSSRLSTTLSFLARDKVTSRIAFLNPFITQLLDAAVTHVLRDIKFKARIPLPGCYNLVGVVDISDTLEKDEIYARIQHSDGTIQHLKGSIAISRSPTNHPGDIRVVRAVGELPPGRGDRIRHLVNCVVFPAKGERSLPSMLAGGDLDGDLYLLLTEKSGLLPKGFTDPAAYDAAPVTRLDRESTLQDGIDFFFEFAAKDLTATVATRQLLLADFYADGLFHPDCLKLAQLHSDCVDYVKSGTHVPFDQVPRIPYEMKNRGGRPDYAAHPGQDSYNSPKALGQLYRAIDFDSIEPPSLETSYVDPGRALTKALLSLRFIDGSKLLKNPPRQLVDHFRSYLSPFSTELSQLADLCHPPAKEEELFLHILVKHKIERSDKNLLSNRGERIDELFDLVRKEIVGKGEDIRERIERAWSAWMAAIESDEEYAAKRRNSWKEGEKGKFGLRSWAFLALGVLGEQVGLLKKEVEVMIID